MPKRGQGDFCARAFKQIPPSRFPKFSKGEDPQGVLEFDLSTPPPKRGMK
jgi:hypothetical protein